MSELASFHALDGQPPAANAAHLDLLDPNDRRRSIRKFPEGTVTTFVGFDFSLEVTPTGTITLKIHWSCGAVTGTVRWGCRIEAKTPGDTLNQNTTASFDTDNLATAQTVQGGAFDPAVTTFTLTNVDGWASGDDVRVEILRDANNDTAASPAMFKMAFLSDAA